MSRFGRDLRAGVGAFALAATVCAASGPADARTSRRVARPAAAPGFAFTPAAADPRLAAAFARSGLGTANFAAGAFRFTPSGGSSRRAITVAVRSRATTRATGAGNVTPTTAAAELAPSAYSLGLSVGWRRFAISGDVARSYSGLLPDARESADFGLSFMGKRWSTKLDLAADRAIGDRPALVGADQSWSLGLGGSYSLTHNLDLSGGVRYKTQRDELNTLISDERRDSQAVYLGTTFRF